MNRRRILQMLGLAPIVATTAAALPKPENPVKLVKAGPVTEANIGTITAGRIRNKSGSLVIDLKNNRMIWDETKDRCK